MSFAAALNLSCSFQISGFAFVPTSVPAPNMPHGISATAAMVAAFFSASALLYGLRSLAIAPMLPKLNAITLNAALRNLI